MKQMTGQDWIVLGMCIAVAVIIGILGSRALLGGPYQLTF